VTYISNSFEVFVERILFRVH